MEEKQTMERWRRNTCEKCTFFYTGQSPRGKSTVVTNVYVSLYLPFTECCDHRKKLWISWKKPQRGQITRAVCILMWRDLFSIQYNDKESFDWTLILAMWRIIGGSQGDWIKYSTVTLQCWEKQKKNTIHNFIVSFPSHYSHCVILGLLQEAVFRKMKKQNAWNKLVNIRSGAIGH